MKPEIACYDIDGTLAKGMLFVPLVVSEHEAGFIDDESFAAINATLSHYKSGTLPYEDAVQQLLESHAKSLTGARVQDVQLHAKGFLNNHPDLFKTFGRSVIELLRGKDFKQFVVTAEPQYLADEVVRYFGLDGAISTKYETAEGAFTGKVNTSLADRSSKSKALNQYAIQYAFGDSEVDIEMLGMAKHPFCIEPTQELAKIAVANGWKSYSDDHSIIESVSATLSL